MCGRLKKVVFFEDSPARCLLVCRTCPFSEGAGEMNGMRTAFCRAPGRHPDCALKDIAGEGRRMK